MFLYERIRSGSLKKFYFVISFSGVHYRFSNSSLIDRMRFEMEFVFNLIALMYVCFSCFQSGYPRRRDGHFYASVNHVGRTSMEVCISRAETSFNAPGPHNHQCYFPIVAYDTGKFLGVPPLTLDTEIQKKSVSISTSRDPSRWLEAARREGRT